MLFIEAHIDGRWQPCATLEPQGGAAGRRAQVRVAYEADYAAAHLDATDLRAVSCRHPVNLAPITSATWPAFLVDLLPQGAAKRRLLQLAGVNEMPEWDLLRAGAWNPVGNLRVRRPEMPPAPAHRGFALAEVMTRGPSFIDYANQVGAAVSGATDTQGEMPKFWLVEDQHGRMHADAGHVDAIAKAFYLVKFPSPEAGDRAGLILNNEASYQRVAKAFGLRVTARLPEVIEGGLLIPRFDRVVTNSGVQRLGVESIYALTGTIENGRLMPHYQAILALHDHVTDFETELLEYLGRDVLNIAMGNRDNHGRNTAVLKALDGTIRLSPLFDFGPTFMDPRAFPQMTHWPNQGAHVVDWNNAILDLATRFEDAGKDLGPYIPAIMRRLRALGDQLEGLPALMRECGVDEEIVGRRALAIDELGAALRALGDTPRLGSWRRAK